MGIEGLCQGQVGAQARLQSCSWASETLTGIPGQVTSSREGGGGTCG